MDHMLIPSASRSPSESDSRSPKLLKNYNDDPSVSRRKKVKVHRSSEFDKRSASRDCRNDKTDRKKYLDKKICYEKDEEYGNAQDRQNQIERIEDKIVMAAAKEIKSKAEEEVKKYIESDDFANIVESMKRRERERILLEIEKELEKEKIELISSRKREIQKVNDEEEKSFEILLQNKIKIEEQQKKDFENKQRIDAERLRTIQSKQIEENEKIHQEELTAQRIKENQFSILSKRYV